MIHGTRPCLPNYTKISPNFANQAHRTGCGRACGPHLSCYSSPRILPQIPQFTGCLAAAAGHIARPPRRRSRRQPHHSASRFLLRFCIATQGPEQPAYSSLPHLSPAAPWELAISWISGRPVLGTMSGGQEDPEGSGDFDWSKLALSFILMRLLEE